MTTGAIRWPAIRSAAAIPSSIGILTSRIDQVGPELLGQLDAPARRRRPGRPPSYPSSASISARSIRISASSSAMTTRSGPGRSALGTGSPVQANGAPPLLRRQDGCASGQQRRSGVPLARGQQLGDVQLHLGALHAGPAALDRRHPRVLDGRGVARSAPFGSPCQRPAQDAVSSTPSSKSSKST